MGHKGVSKRKLPKEKEKPLVTANRGTGLIAGLGKSESVMKQPSGKSQGMPFGQGGVKPSAGTKNDHKNH
jgi:hypothetical protein